jgi:hypothetical protein
MENGRQLESKQKRTVGPDIISITSVVLFSQLWRMISRAGKATAIIYRQRQAREMLLRSRADANGFNTARPEFQNVLLD